MARLFSVLVALFVASASVAAPINLSSVLSSCNIDRFSIVTTLAATGAAVGNIPTTDSATAAAVSSAQGGLTSAGEGIAQIALALVTGGSPPAAARTQVQQGLLDAQTALNSINDPTTNATLSDAQTKLAAAIQDGDAVVKDCV